MQQSKVHVIRRRRDRLQPHTPLCPSEAMERIQVSRRHAGNSGHVALHAGSIVLAVVAQVISGIFFLLTSDHCVPNAVFQTSSRNVSETFPLDVSLDWWSRWYWNFIDLWTTAWLLHSVLGVFKRNALGPESCNPEVHSPLFYLTWSMISIFRVCSLLMWDRHDVLGAVTACWMGLILGVCMLYMSYSNLHFYKSWLQINNPEMISWIRFLTQNGLAAFVWWTLVNALLGLGIIFKYRMGVADPLVSTGVLISVTICIIIWFLLQRVLLKKHLRHTCTVYPVLVLALGAMFTKSYQALHISTNTVFCGFLMLLVTIMSCFHLLCECLYMEEPSKPLATEPSMRIEYCHTVYQFTESKHKPQK
ncbi:uncharacterized protein [Takifugu rubripes]|uniref:uncharacterized protein n=1 Tax=Takifugu rubripes TaxID=31033 RepID=UPI00114570FB|nr:uncharacterized protein LOC115251262 [Takifugu rubripes]